MNFHLSLRKYYYSVGIYNFYLLNKPNVFIQLSHENLIFLTLVMHLIYFNLMIQNFLMYINHLLINSSFKNKDPLLMVKKVIKSCVSLL